MFDIARLGNDISFDIGFVIHTALSIYHGWLHGIIIRQRFCIACTSLFQFWRLLFHECNTIVQQFYDIKLQIDP